MQNDCENANHDEMHLILTLIGNVNNKRFNVIKVKNVENNNILTSYGLTYKHSPTYCFTMLSNNWFINVNSTQYNATNINNFNQFIKTSFQTVTGCNLIEMDSLNYSEEVYLQII